MRSARWEERWERMMGRDADRRDGKPLAGHREEGGGHSGKSEEAGDAGASLWSYRRGREYIS